MIVETHATPHVGRVRKGNEDNYLLLQISESETSTSAQNAGEFIVESKQFEVDENGVILAVSDGMGGAAAGEVASKMAVETVCEKCLEETSEKTISPHKANDSLIGKLYEATVYANYLIHQQGRTEPEYNGMGATFTAIAITPGTVDLIQVGDSRAYLIRNGRINQLTKDQSLVQQLIDVGQIEPEEAETHSLKNVILQALGAQNEIYPVATRLVPRREDVLLLCSDGLSNKIGDADLLKIVSENMNQLQIAAAELVKEANKRGGEDNITLVLAKLTGSDLPEPTVGEVATELLDLGDIHDTADQNRP